MSNNNDFTINDLAGMIKDGFDQVDKRFEQVDKRFEQVDKRFEEVNQRLESLERDMQEVKLKFAYVAWAIDLENLKKRVIDLENRLEDK